MKGSSIESIIRANGDLLEIKNAENMDFESRTLSFIWNTSVYIK